MVNSVLEFHSSPTELEDTDELLDTLEDETELDETLLEDVTELEETLEEERAELDETLELDFAEELEAASGNPSQRTLSISREPVAPVVPKTCQLKAFTFCRAEFTSTIIFVQSGWLMEVSVTVFLVQLFVVAADA